MSDDPSRTIAKRQIARLVSGADLACYVLSESGHIVFANEAFGRLLRTDADELIGLNCSPSALLDSSNHTWASWFAAPPNSSLHRMSIHCDPMPDALVVWITSRVAGDISQKEATAALLRERRWVRMSIPLDDQESPTVLYFMKQDQGDYVGVLDSVRESQLRAIAVQGRVEYPELQSQWYLAGISIDAQRTRSQVRLAASGSHPCRLIGPRGSPLIQSALWIARERLRRGPAKGAGKPEVITIECRLMDRELLTDILEMAEEAMRRNSMVYILLHQLDLLSAELREPLARKLNSGRWMVIATTISDRFSARDNGSGEWDTLIATLDTQSISFAPLSSRIIDIEPLVVAWFEHKQRTQEQAIQVQWGSNFLDALLAYSWPDDCDEFGASLEHVWRQVSSERNGPVGVTNDRQLVLSEKLLPVSLRTFPSHMQRPPIEQSICLDQVLDQMEKDLILSALERKKNNRSAAAQLLGISRSRLLRKLQQWGLGASESASDSEDDSPVFEEVDDADE